MFRIVCISIVARVPCLYIILHPWNMTHDKQSENRKKNYHSTPYLKSSLNWSIIYVEIGYRIKTPFLLYFSRWFVCFNRDFVVVVVHHRMNNILLRRQWYKLQPPPKICMHCVIAAPIIIKNDNYQYFQIRFVIFCLLNNVGIMITWINIL